MAWNQPADDQGAQPRRAAARGGWSRRWRQRWARGPGARAALYAAAAGFALLLWLASGFYQIDDGERGVLQRFGAYAGERGSGAGWHLPWPIEAVTAVDLSRLNTVDFQARMLSSDAMLVNVTASVQFQYADARAVLFAVRDPDAMARELGEALTRELVGQRPIAELMAGAARAPLAAALQERLQKLLDAVGAGLRLVAVNVSDVQVPEAVLAAQRERVQSGLDSERVAREAQDYAAGLMPAAQEQAQKQRLDAVAYKLEAIGAAEGEAARFEPIAAAYERAPEVTRMRMYVETMETLLTRTRKIIVDGKGSGNTLVLPLDKLSDAGALKGAGVVGIAGAKAAGGSAAGVEAASGAGSSGSAGGTGGTGSAAGAGAAGGRPATPAQPGDSPLRERGGRDRTERP